MARPKLLLCAHFNMEADDPRTTAAINVDLQAETEVDMEEAATELAGGSLRDQTHLSKGNAGHVVKQITTRNPATS